MWALCASCGGWAALQLWQRFEFSRKAADLREAWPLLRGSALFFEEALLRRRARSAPYCRLNHVSHAFCPAGDSVTHIASRALPSMIAERNLIVGVTIDLGAAYGFPLRCASDAFTTSEPRLKSSWLITRVWKLIGISSAIFFGVSFPLSRASMIAGRNSGVNSIPPGAAPVPPHPR